MARPSHAPDPASRRQVEALAGFGVRETDIAGLIGVDAKTLRKHYRTELDQGHVKANVKVAENLFKKATGEGREAVTAAIFWLKARAQWKEIDRHELVGDPHQPIHEIRRIILVPGQPQAARALPSGSRDDEA
ncbi:MAG TPA: hypothetical protein VGN97_22740 [Mesorhizobium sp.]|jgi:hypothetical protein|nr:hypothetical protein [Mesorhizobium sp.]